MAKQILTISQPQLKMCTQSGQILQHQIADFLWKPFIFHAYVVPIRYPGTPIYGAPCIKYA